MHSVAGNIMSCNTCDLIYISGGANEYKNPVWVTLSKFLDSAAPGRFAETAVNRSVLFTAQGTPYLNIIFTVSWQLL